MVPFAHGRWLAAHVPGATVHLYAEHGHPSLTEDHVQEILADLAATARSRRLSRSDMVPRTRPGAPAAPRDSCESCPVSH